jgi:hypothetical protein
MAGLVDGIDVASGGELKVALDAGADPREVSFAGPGKREAELRQALAAGVLVNIESFREVRLLAALSQQLGLPARVAVRVNPDFELKGSGMKMGGGPKQFGVDVEQMPELLAEIGRSGLAFEGFHLFAGSQNLRAESICEAQLKSYELALRLAADAPQPVRFLNLGGGFGIPYFPGEQRLDLAGFPAGQPGRLESEPGQVVGELTQPSRVVGVVRDRDRRPGPEPAGQSAGLLDLGGEGGVAPHGRQVQSEQQLLGERRLGDRREHPGGHRRRGSRGLADDDHHVQTGGGEPPRR